MKSAKPCNYRPSFFNFLGWNLVILKMNSIQSITQEEIAVLVSIGTVFWKIGFCFYLVNPKTSTNFGKECPSIIGPDWMREFYTLVIDPTYIKRKKRGKVNKLLDWVVTFLLQSYILKKKKTRIVLLGLHSFQNWSAVNKSMLC